MEEVLLRFGHLAQDILGSLTNKDLVQSREVSRIWKYFMDVEKISQIRRIQKFVKPVIALKKALKRSTIEEIKELASTIQKFQEVWNIEICGMVSTYFDTNPDYPHIEAVVMEDYSIVLTLRFFRCPMCDDSYKEKSEVEIHIIGYHNLAIEQLNMSPVEIIEENVQKDFIPFRALDKCVGLGCNYIASSQYRLYRHEKTEHGINTRKLEELPAYCEL